MFQFIARHLLYTPERYSGGKFRNFPPLLSHVCPAALSFDGYDGTEDFNENGTVSRAVFIAAAETGGFFHERNGDVFIQQADFSCSVPLRR